MEDTARFYRGLLDAKGWRAAVAIIFCVVGILGSVLLFFAVLLPLIRGAL